MTGRPGRQLVEDYLAEVGARLPGPARERASILAELRGGLLDTVDAYRDAGVSAAGTAAAAHASADTATADATAAHAAADTAADVAAAIEEFGDPGLVAAAFGPGLALGQARRVALTLLVTGPLVGLLWATAATASHIGSRQVPPWHWVGALPGSLMVFPLAAAITIAVWTALFTIAATGRATRWLPDRPRLAPGTAAVAGFGAAGADVALFVLLASQAVEMLTVWAFESFGPQGLQRIELLHQVDNLASCRVAQKSGYVLTRVLPADPPAFPADGHLHTRYRTA